MLRMYSVRSYKKMQTNSIKLDGVQIMNNLKKQIGNVIFARGEQYFLDCRISDGIIRDVADNDFVLQIRAQVQGVRVYNTFANFDFLMPDFLGSYAAFVRRFLQ